MIEKIRLYPDLHDSSEVRRTITHFIAKDFRDGKIDSIFLENDPSLFRLKSINGNLPFFWSRTFSLPSGPCQNCRTACMFL